MWPFRKNDDEIFKKIVKLFELTQAELIKHERQIESLQIKLRSKAYKSKKEEDLDVLEDGGLSLAPIDDGFNELRKLNKEEKH